MSEIEFITCADATEWHAWLSAHHADAAEVWVRIAKKGAPGPSVTITETLDGALCYGWIDSHRRRLDAHHYLQRYSPRRPRSPWSQVNVAKAEALIAAGRMRPAGFAAIDEAIADGRWSTAYERQRTAETPADLLTALDAHPAAHTAYNDLGRSDQYRLFLPILKAANPATRAARVAQVIDSLDETRRSLAESARHLRQSARPAPDAVRQGADHTSLTRTARV